MQSIAMHKLFFVLYVYVTILLVHNGFSQKINALHFLLFWILRYVSNRNGNHINELPVKPQLLSYLSPLCTPLSGAFRNFKTYFRCYNAEECTLRHGYGECVALENCTTALEDIKFCDDQNSIVCCPEELSSYPIFTRSKSLEACNKYYAFEKPFKFNMFRPGYNTLIVAGGINALPKEFLHMAALGYEDDEKIVYNCGGSLISENFVLTAAHCIHSVNYGDVKFVRLGDLSLKLHTDEAESQDFQIAKIFMHPDYQPPSTYHDIALLQLDNSAKKTDFVKPACLQVMKEIINPNWIATGWGSLEFGGENADHLQKVDLEEVPFEQCKLKYTRESKRRLKDGIIDEQQICAWKPKKDTCSGDSGGPLQIKQGEAHYVIGVTSFGKACALTDSPGVYTRVSHYVPWIESIVWPN